MSERDELRRFHQHRYWSHMVDQMDDDQVHKCLIKLRQIHEENEHAKQNANAL